MVSLRVFGAMFRKHTHSSLRNFGCMRYYSCETNHDPKLRFVQFLRDNEERHRLGVVSENGSYLTEIPSGSGFPNDMITFIKQNYCISELGEKIKHFKKEEMNESITLLPPVTSPEKIICIGLNYQDHCEEQNKEPPKQPMFFSKFNNTLVGPRGNVIAHKITTKMDWEIELAVIIGEKCKDVSREKALDYVFGYSVAQDISARDWQRSRNGGQFLIAKSMDTFLPIGPSIVHKSLIKNPHDLEMVCKINGIEKQRSNTDNMIYKIDDMISRLSESMTLQPGDVLLTGTPKGVGMYRNPPEYLRVGDVIESEIQCLGKMVNKVVTP
ncbi:fumarylacetoacetate hydrolase domain-containing protein 2 [Musca domestica]|uniref:Fumarylacetoacetate hydrolase domain-containing protein 2 n=1 Tax=Musca domestica TaxID=7370 RepID=A0A1I8MNH6_MUSDO|nr:fumarylacetoacetate hydrolase domain-containing protein 2 [Musca domestica]